MRGARKSRLFVAVGAVSAFVLGSVGAAPTSAAAKKTVLHLGPVTALPGDQLMVSVTNLSDKSQQAAVRIFAEACGVLQGGLTIEPGHTGVLNEPCADNTDTYAVRARVTASGNWLRSAPVALSILAGTDGPTAGYIDTGTTAGLSGSVGGPMMHVVPEHGVRVLVTNLGKTAASFPVSLIDPSGDVVASTTIANVAPGATGFYQERIANEAFVQVRAVVSGPEGTRFLPTVELFDGATNRSILTRGRDSFAGTNTL